MPFNELDLSYIAGFIDGEGSIHFSIKRDRSKPYTRPVLTITQCNKDILEWILKTLDSNSNTVYHKQSVKDSYQDAYHIHFGDQKAYKVLKLMYPYLRVKKAQAKLVIVFYEEFKNERNYSKNKLNLAKRCKELNCGSF